MANNFLSQPSLTAVAMVDTLTLGGTWEANDEVNITLANQAGETVTLNVVAGSTTIATIATTIAAAFNASTNPLFAAITALAGATTVTLTADTAGVPFTCTVTTTENGGGAADAQTFVRTATTANVSTSDWSTALNWNLFAVPVSSDNTDLDGRATAAIIYGLNQSAVTLTKLQIWRSMPYNVGTATAPLRISATTLEIGKNPDDGSNPSGPQLVYVDTGSNASTTTVWGGRTSGVSGMMNVTLKGANAGNSYRQYGGSAGIATCKPGDTAQYPTVTLSAGTLVLGAGMTAPTSLTQWGGALVSRCAVVSLVQNGGECDYYATATMTAAIVGGTFRHYGTGQVTTLTVQGDGFADLTVAPGVARTVPDIVLSGPNCRLKIDASTTVTNSIELADGANVSQVDAPDGVNFLFT